MTTVGDLVEALLKLDQDKTVVMSKDGEGNAFRPVDLDINYGWWDDEDKYFDSYDEDEQEHDRESGNAVCIWPTW